MDREEKRIMTSELLDQVEQYVHEKSILEEAIEIRRGSRNADYGDAVQNFRNIAETFRVMTGREISASDCVRVMMAVKLSRERHLHKRDNLVDLSGYTDILELVVTWEEHQQSTWSGSKALRDDCQHDL